MVIYLGRIITFKRILPLNVIQPLSFLHPSTLINFFSTITNHQFPVSWMTRQLGWIRSWPFTTPQRLSHVRTVAVSPMNETALGNPSSDFPSRRATASNCEDSHFSTRSRRSDRHGTATQAQCSDSVADSGLPKVRRRAMPRCWSKVFQTWWNHITRRLKLNRTSFRSRRTSGSYHRSWWRLLLLADDTFSP